VDFEPLRFIGEPIEAVFGEPPVWSKSPGCPDGFVWRGKTYRIVELLGEWCDFTRRGKMARNMRESHLAAAVAHGSLGVGRFTFRVRTDKGRIFELYYDRAPRSVDDRKGAWTLYRELAYELIAYCGLVCHTCPIYLATREEDGEKRARMRAEIAELCREQYGMAYEPEDITDCDGCRTEGGRLFSACNDCAIRKCARQKELESCACCDAYVCEKLEAFFATEPAARTRLDGIKSDVEGGSK
jgi:hypothetical protein